MLLLDHNGLVTTPRGLGGTEAAVLEDDGPGGALAAPAGGRSAAGGATIHRSPAAGAVTTRRSPGADRV
ncbi:hypothetical protein GCM10010517_76120 [Streptosporangium fragile]|uniref:Uncharacterized protein n=1 Tax=Streptosporangium fragile TaxID=46186 RepID=A0ABN3WCA7_9ACTN